MRVALLTNVLTPYRLPVYRDLASTPGWRLRVMVSAETDATWSRAFAGAHERGAGELDVAVVRSLALRRRYAVHASADATQHVTTHVPLGALAALQRFRPDIVVSAELGPRTLLAAAYAALASRPLVIWSYQSRAAADAAGGLHNALRRALLTRADAVVGMGRQAREVLRALGVAGEHLFDAPNAHDATALEAALAATEPTVAQAALRGGFGCRPRVALVLGRLVAAKGLRPLLAAWERLPAGAKRDWTLLFVGDGPLRGEIAAAARRAEPGEIVATGAVPAADVAALYAGVDLLVFPSLGDPWVSSSTRPSPPVCRCSARRSPAAPTISSGPARTAGSAIPPTLRASTPAWPGPCRPPRTHSSPSASAVATWPSASRPRRWPPACAAP